MYEEKRKQVEDNKKLIEQKMRERDLLNKDVVDAEDQERDFSSQI